MANETGTAEAPSQSAPVELTSEIVAAYVGHNHARSGDVPGLLATVHAALADLGRPPETEAVPVKPVPPLPIRKTITDEPIISLEDGRLYQTLKRHLTKRGLTPGDYREKWGLRKGGYPMVAPGYAKACSALAKQIGLGSMRRKGPARPQA